MNIAFRVDANQYLGTGHLIRCLVVAKALAKRGHAVVMVCRRLEDSLAALIRQANIDFVSFAGDAELLSLCDRAQRADAISTQKALPNQPWDAVVVDHYFIDARWESLMRASVGLIVVIDDLANRSHDCDILLDQNTLPIDDSRYAGKVPASCVQLLGSRYVLLADSFAQKRPQKLPSRTRVNNILVSFGGVDAANYTHCTLCALSNLHLQDVTVTTAVGAANPHRQAIVDYCQQHRFDCHIQTQSMADLMQRADMAVGAGGVSVWERCCLGLPTIALCSADNQREQLCAAASQGLLMTFDVATNQASLIQQLQLHIEALYHNPQLRQHIAESAHRALDGRGVERLVKAILKHQPPRIDMRAAKTSDAEKTWHWRNHPDTVANSLSPKTIVLNEHIRWWVNSLHSPQRALLIVQCDGEDIGVLRYDIDGATATVSIYLGSEWQNRGFASIALQTGKEWLLLHHPHVSLICACIKADNKASIAAFQKAGFATHHLDLRASIKS